ncbi:MAG: MacS family sensor histidine kinase [Dermatophilaceae bacterium]
MGPLKPRSARTGRREPVVVVAFHRGLDIFRPCAALYAALLVWQRHEAMVRPWVAVVILALMLAWSLGLLVYRGRTRRVVVVEVSLAVLGILATTLAETPASIAAGQFTLPTVWAAGPVVAAALGSGARGGLVAAAVIAVADLIQVREPTQATLHNIVILVLLGGLVGLAVDLARSGLAQEEQVLRERERLHERERIARVVHDGVLQSLAYIHRRGNELAGPAVELAELAADQERALRRFVSGVGAADAGALGVLHGAEGAEVDLRIAVSTVERPGVDVSVPAGPILVDPVVAAEIGAALGAALDNVAVHAGPRARSWVLLEGDARSVELTVRDDGMGTEPARLVDAAADGRLGVSASIRGRIEDLGGSATWTTRPGAGCTVRIIIPRGSVERR